MKLIEIASRIDKSKQNEEWVSTEDIGYEIGIDNVPHTEQNRLKCFWVGNWYCTDSYVGYRMYFFDDEPVAFSIQKGRKCEEKFNWFSLESATKLKEYLLSLIIEEEKELNIDICDINEDVGDNFRINYSGQILKSDKATLDGEIVEILERIKNKPYGIDTELKVKLSNGEEKNVDIRDLRFGFHIN
jgi:hypothetical protein